MVQARDEVLIREKIHFFRKSAFWPHAAQLDTDGWLENFTEDERPVALILLDSFLYFSGDVTTKILNTEFHKLSNLVAPLDMAITDRMSRWAEFKERVILTYPTDEEPGATDSGRSYLRKARGVLNLDESQFADPHDALARLHEDPTRPVLFIDDFVGTGNQFIQTLNRPYTVHGEVRTFSDYVGARQIYMPILCTESASERIVRHAPALQLRPGHLLSDDYSIFHPESIVWPDGPDHDAIDVVRAASERAGIPMGEGGAPNDWCGFGRLGLSVAIDDTIPDASLTIFYWEENGWRPLKRRP